MRSLFGRVTTRFFDWSQSLSVCVCPVNSSHLFLSRSHWVIERTKTKRRKNQKKKLVEKRKIEWKAFHFDVSMAAWQNTICFSSRLLRHFIWQQTVTSKWRSAPFLDHREPRRNGRTKKKCCLFNNKVSHYQDVCNACNRKDTEKEKHEDGDGGSSGSGDNSQPTCNQYQPAHAAHILSKTQMGN